MLVSSTIHPDLLHNTTLWAIRKAIPEELHTNPATAIAALLRSLIPGQGYSSHLLLDLIFEMIAVSLRQQP
jgi:hypothetical protein